MAKPIPVLDLRTLSRVEELEKEELSGDGDGEGDGAGAESEEGEEASPRYSAEQAWRVAAGVAGGWYAGRVLARAGGRLACALGGAALAAGGAAQARLVRVRWARVRALLAAATRRLAVLRRLAAAHSALAVGFLAGLCFDRSDKSIQQVAAIEEERPANVTERNSASAEPAAKPSELTKLEEPPPLHEKTCPATFIAPKVISHSPKISPSSIPNPSPSVSTTKQMEPGYPNYGGYMYSVPGYSAFQPVSYPGMVKPTSTAVPLNNSTETNKSEYDPFPMVPTKDKQPVTKEDVKNDTKPTDSMNKNLSKTQQDFKENIAAEVKPTSITESNKIPVSETKMSVTSLIQGSGETLTIPPHVPNKDIKKKPPEKFSLKTSIPISKIDMKCVSNPPDSTFHTNLSKKPFNPAFHSPSIKDIGSKIEIQSNIIIKSASKESELKDIPSRPTLSNSISTLINAAEVINKTDSQFKIPEAKPEVVCEAKDTTFTPPATSSPSHPLYNPINLETAKTAFSAKASVNESFSETKNQIVFIQNKNQSNAKMLVAIQQQNPQVLLQRSNFDQKNLQAPSRPSSQSKKCKEELVNENGTSSKVVSLKRLHQDNCDENDFENLITENQIYGNKIVVKEKSQGTSQEQDLKNKSKTDKSEAKNLVLQPNFVYLSNVQFSSANLMMIKNNNIKVTDHTIRTAADENKQNEVVSNNEIVKSCKNQNIPVSKEIHVLKSSNSILQTLSGKNHKPDIVFQSQNPKVIMNPQIVYQVPMIVDTDNRLNQSFVKDYPKFVSQNKIDLHKQFDHKKSNDKLYIACPYQMDSKLQPKIVITNIRPKIAKVEEISTLDMYEQRKRLRRLKYLTNRETKQSIDNNKTEIKKTLDNFNNIITPENMEAEIYKEFAKTRINIQEGTNESDSDYEEEDIEKYNCIIREFGEPMEDKECKENEYRKAQFLAQFKLGSLIECRDIELERQERIIKRDAIASAYIAAGRIDCLLKEESSAQENITYKLPYLIKSPNKSIDKKEDLDQEVKRTFLINLNLMKVSQRYKEGFENVWQEVIKDRKRREDPTECGQILSPKLQVKVLELDPRGQLEILTEIKKHVNENNNLIKKRFDLLCYDGESIKMLAEKNFSELSRLSNMADRSVKHFSGQETRKRDLNPGFDSENIQKRPKTGKYYSDINIPDISKIISLKTVQSVDTASSAPATSMDEPPSSAAGAKDGSEGLNKFQEVGCQVEEFVSWAGVEAIIKNYKEYEIGRKKEMAELQRRSTRLRVEAAHARRAAAQEGERARALVAERRSLAAEELALRHSLHWLRGVADLVRNYVPTTHLPTSS